MSTEATNTVAETREAVKEAIRICKEQNVLRDYLTEKEAEVVDMIMAQYSQAQAIDDYVASVKFETTIQTIVTCYKELGLGIEAAAQVVAQELKIPLGWAMEKVQMYW